jgi:hypothetical protein
MIKWHLLSYFSVQVFLYWHGVNLCLLKLLNIFLPTQIYYAVLTKQMLMVVLVHL